MLSYSGGGVMRAGGGSCSSNAGGLKDGARRRCIGRCIACGPAMWAVGGRARPGDCTASSAREGSASLLSCPLRAVFRAFKVGTNDADGRLAAPGQPHSKREVERDVSDGLL